ncbi:5-hydroxytryptamine receptor 3A-like [Archocentrus centrarchus]|uniref:5-hydroxytryptamine receptor 3A-like n=1 Tax=Archocentrus centrarchus TaxID=63155 RepID=UPI0011EA0299|nr:5-hydroxytryptamine receptor 3A-like [Archocentrus centrarchus]
MAEVKAAELSVTCFMLLHGFVAALNCTSPTPVALIDELEKNLFSKKWVRPVKSFSDPLNISLSITVVGILGLDEKSQTLSSVLWQDLEWDIEGLKWDEKECGAERVSVLREKLWIPDIDITEALEEVSSTKTPYVYLYNTGHVYDDQPIKVVTSCQLGIYTFPFDIQNCSLTFGSYLHFAEDIKMIQGTTAEDILKASRKVLETNGEWELTNVSVADSTLEIGDSYSQITYYIILRRRPFLYVVNLLIPSCFLVTVDLFSFVLPPQSVDRSAFKMTLILGYTVFLLIMNDLLPATGETTPLINVFFSISLALMVASLLETLFITNIQFKSSEYSAVPRWLSVLVLHFLAVLVCIPPKERSSRVTVSLSQPHRVQSTNSSAVNLPDHQSISCVTLPVKTAPTSPVLPEPALDELRQLRRDVTAIRLQMDKYFEGNKAAQEWEMIGRVIDRLLFGLYIVFILVSFVTIISIWVWNNSFAK